MYIYQSRNNNNKEKIKPKQLVNFCHLKFIKRRLKSLSLSQPASQLTWAEAEAVAAEESEEELHLTKEDKV